MNKLLSLDEKSRNYSTLLISYSSTPSQSSPYSNSPMNSPQLNYQVPPLMMMPNHPNHFVPYTVVS